MYSLNQNKFLQVLTVLSTSLLELSKIDGCIVGNLYHQTSFCSCQAANSANRFTPANSMCSKSRKRKRLKENIAQLASEGEIDMYAKRRSSEYGGISMSPNSFLDASNTPDKSDLAGSYNNLNYSFVRTVFWIQ